MRVRSDDQSNGVIGSFLIVVLRRTIRAIDYGCDNSATAGVADPVTQSDFFACLVPLLPDYALLGQLAHQRGWLDALPAEGLPLQRELIYVRERLVSYLSDGVNQVLRLLVSSRAFLTGARNIPRQMAKLIRALDDL